MADEDPGQEKTEEATPRRLEKAKEDGQIPRSKELTTSAILIAGAFGLLMTGGFMGQSIMTIMSDSFALERQEIFDTYLMVSHLGSGFKTGLLSILPLFAILLVASILGPIGLGGWLFSTKSLAPKMNRISPLAGLKRMFSVKSMVELVKAIAKVLLVGFVSWFMLLSLEGTLIDMLNQPLHEAIRTSVESIMFATIMLAFATLLIAMVDIPFQIWDHAKKLKMTNQEVKDEMKDTEGKPEVKGRIRQLQRELANNRMMAQVPEADVVITNPTHFSVALSYDPNGMATPVLLAKGGDLVALKIREIAKEHKIEIIESPALARSIFHTTEVDQEIPGGLYMAVAQVLAYVFQLRNYRNAGGAKPDYPRNIHVPHDLRYD